MAATVAADFTFVPKVWEDEISAYWPKKLVFGSLASINTTLQQKPGTTINFPFFENIGDAEEPLESADLALDNLSDSSFSATVKEVGKAVGVKRKALMVAASEQDVIFGEIQKQMGRVLAEKVDADLLTEINLAGNHVQGNTAADTQKANVQRILQGLIDGLGDRQDEVVALVMHSQAYLNIMTDSTSGFLKADANDPFWNQPGFMGRLLGKALFITDQCPQGTAIATKRVYHMYALKANPYGIIVKRAPDMESDYDVLAREYVFAMTQWYAVKGFHSKSHADDKRVVRLSFQCDQAV